ncbi:MAG: type II toxin-antitoxin system VapC family toxin [Pseudoxanthomonas suwonensis]|nr:type II toxin-antitoxin system VapC family toxin [Pseudoxanthomonas suwonensis]
MYLLDTLVVSELRKVRANKADPRVVGWANSVDTHLLHLSVVSVEELELGVLLAERRDPQKGAILRKWLHRQVMVAFDRRILAVDSGVALRSAALHCPDPRPIRDALIAATALEHGLTVVTRNTAAFSPMGVALLDPWQA